MRLSALSVLHSKSVLCGAFVWARGALNDQERWFPAPPSSAVERADATAAELLLGAGGPRLLLRAWADPCHVFGRLPQSAEGALKPTHRAQPPCSQMKNFIHWLSSGSVVSGALAVEEGYAEVNGARERPAAAVWQLASDARLGAEAFSQLELAGRTARGPLLHTWAPINMPRAQ